MWMMSLDGCHGDVRKGRAEEEFLLRDWLKEQKQKELRRTARGGAYLCTSHTCEPIMLIYKIIE